MPASPLRERQASLARTAMFEALVHHLESRDADDIAMEDLAQEAGVSRRTLYRYFPTRSALLAEASEWIRDELSGKKNARRRVSSSPTFRRFSEPGLR